MAKRQSERAAAAARAPAYDLHTTLRGHERSVSSVKFSPDGEWIASSSADQSVRLWSARTSKFDKSLVGHDGGVSDVAWSADSRLLATASDDKLVKLWEAASGRCLITMRGHTNYVFCVKFNPQVSVFFSHYYIMTEYSTNFNDIILNIII